MTSPTILHMAIVSFICPMSNFEVLNSKTTISEGISKIIFIYEHFILQLFLQMSHA